MRWWHRLLYRLTHPRKWAENRQRHFWSGISILVFKENAAEEPKRIRINYIMLLLALLLLAGLPLVNLGILALEKGQSGKEKSSERTRLVLVYNIHDNLKAKRLYLQRIRKQLIDFQRLREKQSLFALRKPLFFQKYSLSDNSLEESGQKYYNLDLLRRLHSQARLLLKKSGYHSLHLLWHQATLHSVLPRGRPLNGGAGVITSGFGYRENPTSLIKSQEFHSGLDFADAPGTPLTATASGYVFRAVTDPSSGYGKHVQIHHGFGYLTLYAHCRELNVTKGQYVHRGDVVGFLGRTGRVTGNHVHYEVQFGNEPSVNPIDYVQLR